MKKYRLRKPKKSPVRLVTTSKDDDGVSRKAVKRRRMEEEDDDEKVKRQNTTIVETETTKRIDVETLYPHSIIIRDISKVSEGISSSSSSVVTNLLKSLRLDDKKEEKCELKVYERPTFDVPSDARFILLTGASGTGKTRCMNSLQFCPHKDKATTWTWSKEEVKSPSSSSEYCFPKDRAIVSCFDEDKDEARKWLSSCGLNSIPDWCKPYHILSTGQKYRAMLARQMWQHYNKKNADSKSSILRLDNFASHLDGVIAKSCANALSKQIRRVASKKLDAVIICTTRNDLSAWIQPDIHIHFVTKTHVEMISNSNKTRKPIVSIRVSPKRELLLLNQQQVSNKKCDMDLVLKSKLEAMSVNELTKLLLINGFPMKKSNKKKKSLVKKCLEKITYGVNPTCPICHRDLLDEVKLRIRLQDAKLNIRQCPHKIYDRNLKRAIRCSFVGKDEDWRRRKFRFQEDEVVSYFEETVVFKEEKEEEEVEDTKDKKTTDTHIIDDDSTSRSVVLAAKVKLDECTSMCDTFFDAAFDGNISTRMPKFPSRTVWKDGDDDNDVTLQIGIICGRSGSAKSAVATLHFGKPLNVLSDVTWHADISVRNHFSSVEIAKEYLEAVGLSDLREPVFVHEISDGERSRASLARVLSVFLQQHCDLKKKSPLVIDEFTSLLDRKTAVRVAQGVRDLIMKQMKSTVRLVVVSCHEEFASPNSEMLHALCPRWRYDCNLETCEQFDEDSFGDFSSSFRDVAVEKTIPIPELKFNLVPCDLSFWKHFRAHHYKSEYLSTKSRCFVLVESSIRTNEIKRHCLLTQRRLVARGSVVGFVASIEHFGWKDQHSNKYPSRRAHRTVILPAWQGLGIGSCLSDACAELHVREGFLYFGQTVHPHFGQYRDRSALWKASPWNHTYSTFKVENWKQRLSSVRIRRRIPKYVYSHRYIGDDGDAFEFCSNTSTYSEIRLFSSLYW